MSNDYLNNSMREMNRDLRLLEKRTASMEGSVNELVSLMRGAGDGVGFVGRVVAIESKADDIEEKVGQNTVEIRSLRNQILAAMLMGAVLTVMVIALLVMFAMSASGV